MDKVTYRRLPLVGAPIPPGGGRLATPAGELAQVVNGDSFRFLAVLEFRDTRQRGNHVHRFKEETLYVLRGRLRATYEDLDNGDRLTMELTTGDLVTVAPNCAHGYAGLENTLAVEFAAIPYDPGDTTPRALEIPHRHARSTELGARRNETRAREQRRRGPVIRELLPPIATGASAHTDTSG